MKFFFTINILITCMSGQIKVSNKDTCKFNNIFTIIKSTIDSLVSDDFHMTTYGDFASAEINTHHFTVDSVVLEYYYGYPLYLYTPMGRIRLTRDVWYTNGGKLEVLTDKLIGALNLTVLDPVQKTVFGLVGPYYYVNL